MNQPGILSGMRVVEAAAFVAAPLGGMTLAQMGADVIRIDALGGGLDYRRWPVTRKTPACSGAASTSPSARWRWTCRRRRDARSRWR